MLIFYPPMMIACSLRSIKHLSPFNIIATIALVIGLCNIFNYLFDDLPNSKGHTLIASYTTWPLYWGIAYFSWGAVGIALLTENELKEPKRMLGLTGIIHVSNWFVVAMFIAMGFFGYFKYGKDTAGSITFNLPLNQM